jgi:acyl-coenzyme A synthetase/AMP-(fatty) acid ligase
LRAEDLRLRIDATSPALIVADERNREELERRGAACPVTWAPDPALFESAPPASSVELDQTDPCLITFTSGSAGGPQPVLHVQRYLLGQRLQGEHWVGVCELLADPRTVPTFFHSYLGDDPVPLDQPWRTGDRVACDEDGYQWFEAVQTT